MILIVAIALPSRNRNISPNLYLRISSLLLLYTGALTQLFDIVIVLTGSVILIA
jgi:hypothetical protein